MNAVDIAYRNLGQEMRCSPSRGLFKQHDLLLVGYSEGFDLAVVEPQIRRELDDIQWLFVTTGKIEFKGHEMPGFGMAPILPKKLTVAYHATRACLIPRICGENGEGLLPSNAERRASHFPDTEGTIHVCEKLSQKGDGKDSAEWWASAFSRKNNFNNDPNWGIVRIDMSQLPATARVYQDMHSSSGSIVDRIDRIPGRLVKPVAAQ